MREENDIYIYKAPIILSDNSSFSFNADENLLLYELTFKFYQTIKANISEEDLKLFYNNIRTLQYKVRTSFFNIFLEIFYGKVLYGSYDVSKNEIIVIDNSLFKEKIDVSTVSHELFHTASSFYDNENDMDFSGLSQRKSITVIGDALNEGYTELLNNRYFGPIPKCECCYEYEMLISSLVEDIVGQDKMTSFYFNADLYGLVKELEKYTTYLEIINFICNLDILSNFGYRNYHLPNNWVYLNVYFNKITKFLFETYIKKLEIDFKNNKITQKGFDIRINKYAKKLKKAIKIDYFMSKIDLRQNILDTLTEIGVSKRLQMSKRK